jgi:tetratricopeptide (TPR) repeat protein
MYALTMLDRTYRLKGDFNQSTTLLDRLFALTDEYGLTVQLAQHMASRGDCYVHCGRVAEGVALLEEAVETAKAKKVMFDLPQMLLYLAEGYLVAGRAEAALPCAQEALTLTKQRAERLFEGHALQLAAEAASCADPQDLGTCEEWFRSAIKVFDEGSARPYLARCHLAFGAFYRRIGRRQETERHLTTAAAMFNQMGMTYWLEKAEAEIAALNR